MSGQPNITLSSCHCEERSRFDKLKVLSRSMDDEAIHLPGSPRPTSAGLAMTIP